MSTIFWIGQDLATYQVNGAVYWDFNSLSWANSTNWNSVNNPNPYPYLPLPGDDVVINPSANIVPFAWLWGDVTVNSIVLNGASGVNLYAPILASDLWSLTVTANFVNDATVAIDEGIAQFGPDSPYYFNGVIPSGGGHVSIGGALINSGAFSLGYDDIGGALIGMSDQVTAGSLANTGTLHIAGGIGSVQALMSVGSPAGFGTAGVLTGNVFLEENAVIDFASGSIASIAAASTLTLVGDSAFIAYSVYTTTNSALAGLTNVSGALNLDNRASIANGSNPLADSGAIALDGSPGQGGSTLFIGGLLTSSGSIVVGDTTLSSTDSLLASGVANAGTINLYGSGAYQALLRSYGDVTNSGQVTVGANAALEIVGGQYAQFGGSTQVFGALFGPVTLSGGGFEIHAGGSVAGTIGFAGVATLTLDAATSNTIANFAAGDAIDFAALAYHSSYETVWRASATGGSLQIVDTANANAVVATLQFAGQYSGETFQAASDGAQGLTISLASLPPLQPRPGDVVVSSITGQAYSTYMKSYDGGVLSGTETFYSNVAGQNYLVNELDYAPGGQLFGTKSFFSNPTSGLPYTSYEYDYDGSGRLTRAYFSGFAGAPYVAYENDYVGGRYVGSKYTYNHLGLYTYSSYEQDRDAAGALVETRYFYTAVGTTAFSSEEKDYNAARQLTRDVRYGVTGRPYQAIEYDYVNGVYTRTKQFFAGIVGASYAGKEVDYAAGLGMVRVIYTGVIGTSYSSYERDYTGGAVTQTITNTTNVPSTTANYYADQLVRSATGIAEQITYELTAGGHKEVALAAGQSLASQGEDQFFANGKANTNFVLSSNYAADEIFGFSAASSDVVSFALSEFATFASVQAAASNVAGGVVIRAADGDSVLLAGLTVASLTAADFAFHA